MSSDNNSTSSSNSSAKVTACVRRRRDRPISSYFLQTTGPSLPNSSNLHREVFLSRPSTARRRVPPSSGSSLGLNNFDQNRRTKTVAEQRPEKQCSTQSDSQESRNSFENDDECVRTITAPHATSNKISTLPETELERPKSAPSQPRKPYPAYSKHSPRKLRLRPHTSTPRGRTKIPETKVTEDEDSVIEAYRPSMDADNTADLRAQMRRMLLELRSQCVQSTKHAPGHQNLKVIVGLTEDSESGIANNANLQSSYLERPTTSKVLAETPAPTTRGPNTAGGTGPSALDQVESRIVVMHSSYNAIHAEVNELTARVQSARDKRNEVAAQLAKDSDAREALESQVSKLEAQLHDLESENSHLVNYLPTMRYMLERSEDSQKVRQASIAGKVEALKILEEGEEETNALCKMTKRESEHAVQQRAALEISLRATERKYFEALAERRDEIAKVDALTGYLASSIQNLFSSDTLNSNLHGGSQRVHLGAAAGSTKSLLSLVGEGSIGDSAISKGGVLGGRAVLESELDPIPEHGVSRRRTARIKSKLAKQEMANIASIISHKGKHAKEIQQQLGTNKYGPREIQTIFKSIEERSGVKIITPQEMLDWAHTNREVEANIYREEATVQKKIQELAATKQQLTEQLSLIDQRAGSTNARLKQHAYEDLHRELNGAKQRKQEARARIQERGSMLAAFSVCIQGLCEKLEGVSMHEEWVHKLDTTHSLLTSQPKQVVRKGKTDSDDSHIPGNHSGGATNTGSVVETNLLQNTEVAKAIHHISVIQEKIGQVNRLCELAAQAGLLTTESLSQGSSVPIMDRARLDLNCIKDPQPATNVRVRANTEEELSYDDLRNQSLKIKSSVAVSSPLSGSLAGTESEIAASPSKRTMGSRVSKEDRSAASQAGSGKWSSQHQSERRLCNIFRVDRTEDIEFQNMRAQLRNAGQALKEVNEEENTDHEAF